MKSETELTIESVRLRRQIEELARSGNLHDPDVRRGIEAKAAEIRKQLADHLMVRMIENRPEVISRGQPISGAAAQAGQLEARTRLEATRAFKDACSDCPAAQVMRRVDGGVNVRCGVEHTLLSSASDPQSLLTFCMGDHEVCPSWRAQRDSELAGRKKPLVAVGEGV